MRNVLAFIAALALGTANGQPVLELVGVVQVEGQTASQLYRKAERWMVDAFRDPSEAIDLRDTVTHTLVAKGFRTLGYTVGKGLSMVYAQQQFNFSLEVACKDGRYRVRIYNGILGGHSQIEFRDTCYVAVPAQTGSAKNRMMPVEIRDQTCVQVMDLCRSLSESLRAAMLKEEDDW